jgi:hypothetical protein
VDIQVELDRLPAPDGALVVGKVGMQFMGRPTGTEHCPAAAARAYLRGLFKLEQPKAGQSWKAQTFKIIGGVALLPEHQPAQQPRRILFLLVV